MGVRIISRVNNIGVIAELIGAVGLILLLIINIKHGPSVLFKTDGTGTGHDWGYFGALLVGAIMPLYVMYGFDTAGSLAEETADPRRTAPRALIRALLTAGILGFLLIGFGTMAVDKGATGFGLTSITKDVLGDTWGKIWLADVALAIFVCCLAIQAMSIRILFSMARDDNLPFARAIASVSAQRRVPSCRRSTSGVIALIILAFNIVNPSAFTIIISLGIILMYLAYLGVTIPLLRKRLAGWPGNLPDAKDGLFSLGTVGRDHERDRDRLRRGDGREPRVAAHRALHRRHVQVGPDRRDARSGRVRGGLLLRHPAAQGRGARGAPRRGCRRRLTCAGWAGAVPPTP